MDYSNTGNRWTQEEEEHMLHLYIDREFDVVKIAKKHHRTPRAIALRLVKCCVISHESEARGYQCDNGFQLHGGNVSPTYHHIPKNNNYFTDINEPTDAPQLATNSGKNWTQTEEEQLLHLYYNKKLSIMEIAKQHRRTPKAITMRLAEHGILVNEPRKDDDDENYTFTINKKHFHSNMSQLFRMAKSVAKSMCN